MAEPAIRVDQAHCNYHLALSFEAQHETILYRDAGRATRGGTGLKGEVHNLFVQRGWPIPDIVSLSATGTVSIIEIDSPFSQAAPSLRTYDLNRVAMLAAFRDVLRTQLPDAEPTAVQLGFCRMGKAGPTAIRQLEALAGQNPHVDRWYAFEDARSPVRVDGGLPV